MTQDMMTLRALLEKSSDADLLREMIGFTAERLMALEVEGLTGAGRGRLADESDRELVLDWFRDFAETVGLPAHQREAIRDEAAAFLEAGAVYVWEDRGDCRAMVSHTPAGLAPGRIRAVYAPPGSRGHGYASACVCYVCRVLRDEKGWPYCLLFADVDSAPANRLYQRVGFKLLHTFQEYDFED